MENSLKNWTALPRSAGEGSFCTQFTLIEIWAALPVDSKFFKIQIYVPSVFFVPNVVNTEAISSRVSLWIFGGDFGD
jgi:hypothetical protein